jgi:hypothetical protein
VRKREGEIWKDLLARTSVGDKEQVLQGKG